MLEEVTSSPAERRSILHGYIEPTPADREDGRKVPTRAHQAIAQLVKEGYVRVIITTNFDRLLESALREIGIEPTLIYSADALKGAEPLVHTQCYVVKLHGDYKDARILNTDEELSTYPPEFDALLDRILDEHGLIVAGWSGDWDHALRAAILRCPSRRYGCYWAVRTAPSDAASELITARKATVVPIADADTFFVALQQRVATLHKTRRTNPSSIDLAVNSAKRFLPRPEHRIDLEDLVAHQLEELKLALDDPQFSNNAPLNADAFTQRVQLYESLVEPLARVVGVLGRWGTGSEVGIVIRVINALYSQAEKNAGGTVVWIVLRSYPAVLLFAVSGLAMTASSRWSDLHKLLSARITRLHDQNPVSVVGLLFAFAWLRPASNDPFKNLPGKENRKTALHDHLLEVLTVWRGSFAGVLPDLELVFDRFEVLASLSYFENLDKLSIEAELKNPQGFEWMPVGRTWNGRAMEIILEELQGPLQLALLEAGFANGEREWITLFSKNLGRFIARSRF